tara:strand:- start:2453 stop:2635 length:183 start_codon:yes stop_codon:yes gene_type:complete
MTFYEYRLGNPVTGAGIGPEFFQHVVGTEAVVTSPQVVVWVDDASVWIDGLLGDQRAPLG